MYWLGVWEVMSTIHRIRFISTGIIANLESITPLFANAWNRQQFFYLVSVPAHRMPDINGVCCEFITGSLNNDAQLPPFAYKQLDCCIQLAHIPYNNFGLHHTIFRCRLVTLICTSNWFIIDLNNGSVPGQCLKQQGPVDVIYTPTNKLHRDLQKNTKNIIEWIALENVILQICDHFVWVSIY